MSLTSCVERGNATPNLNGCDWVQPIYLSDEDILTKQTEKDILLHNENWKDICLKL